MTMCECGSDDVSVVDSRPMDYEQLSRTTITRRRRECHSCKERWTTFEVREDTVNIINKARHIVKTFKGILSQIKL